MTTHEKPMPGKVYSLTAIAEGKSLSEAEVTSANPHPSDAEKAARESYPERHQKTEPPAQLPLAEQYDRDGARMRRDSKRADAVREMAAAEASDEPSKSDPRPAIGSILSCSWGYDQTNAEFYEVVAHNGISMITVRQVVQELIESEGSGSERVAAVPGRFLNEKTYRRKVDDWGGIAISSFQHASPWDGTPRHQTATGWGH